MTLDAADNLAALPARSPELPLHATTEMVGRRLADHLRETGVTAVIVDDVRPARRPRSARSGAESRMTVGLFRRYGIPVDERFAERLAEVWSHPTEKLDRGGIHRHLKTSQHRSGMRLPDAGDRPVRGAYPA